MRAVINKKREGWINTLLTAMIYFIIVVNHPFVVQPFELDA